METSDKKRSLNDEVVLCCNVNINTKNVLSNRIYGYDQEWCWDDVLTDLSGEWENDHDNLTTGLLKSDNLCIQLSVSAKLNGSEKFFPDRTEAIKKVIQFDNSLKYVTFDITTKEARKVEESNSCSINAFNILMPKEVAFDKKPKLKVTDGPRFTGNIISLKIDLSQNLNVRIIIY